MASGPTINRMFLTSVWFESVVYGINCVLFGACIWILVNRNRKSHRVLFASCIFHISVSTAHSVISLLISLEAFTTPWILSIPNGSTVYIVAPTTYMLTNLALFVSNVLAQDLLLIWRLYVAWNYNWKLVIPALILEVVHIACAIVAVFLIAQPNHHLFSHNVQAFGKASWSLGLFLNTAITCGIAYRFWYVGQKVSDHTGRNAYKAAMFTVIESGALIASCTVVMFILDVVGSQAGFMAFNVAVQIASTTPLLIITRLGLGATNTDTNFGKSSAPSMTFAPTVQIGVTQHTSTFPTTPTTPILPFTRQKTESMRSINRGG
ncbi:hypothetical protein DEU56DRAFT_865082 [Suillus clintonianus]|uniref:uncharacterized protein n=1 Tax=Suillus clintonianus TaxID=1904413 RepID=UPI001B86AA77|nr:uncharacterized protein DEU56DRAFT_865082 [Suillus clintonianus]KAG2121254.1 hypothetical protein DEU56DRAFT_865082 [Suillus clintonianus]